MQQVSIIIPIYNEQAHLKNQISNLLKKLSKLKKIKYEIILIENGSKDKTYSIAKKLAKENTYIKAKKISLPSYGDAIRLGIINSKYNLIVQLDLDLIDFFFIKKSLYLLKTNDIVIGSKLHPQSKDKRPLSRVLATHLLNYIIRKNFYYRGTDTHGIKSYKKNKVLKIINQVKSKHHFFDTELILRAQKASFKIVEIPIKTYELRRTRFPTTLRLTQAIRELMQLINHRSDLASHQNTTFLADDFGYNAAGDKTMRKLTSSDKVSIFSVLPNYIDLNSSKNIEFLKKNNFAAHINLVEGKPISSPQEIPSLTDKKGNFYPLPLFVFRIFLGLISQEEIKTEINSQINLLKLVSTNIKELNSHQHTHALSPVAEAIYLASKNFKVKKVRSYANIGSFTLNAKVKYWILKTSALISSVTNKRRLDLPLTWKIKSHNKMFFMSWESKKLKLFKIQGRTSQVDVVIHPGLPFDSNTEYKNIIK